MFDPSKHNHSQIIDVHPNVSLKPDGANVLPHNLRTSSEERATSGGSRVELHKESDQVDYRGFSVSWECEGSQEGAR
jgi:hypothetical protein